MEETKKTKKVEKLADAAQVTITPEVLAIMENMIESRVRSSAKTDGDKAFSVYGARDPKTIESVNVKRILGKFVIGFKDLQDDEFKKVPKYLRYQMDPIRKLANQPYITLLLSNNGKDIEEKEILLSDYYNERDYFKVPVIDVKVKKIISQNGLLGRGGGDLAREIDDKGRMVSRNGIKAEVAFETRVFVVELPGFDEPVEFIEDFLS